MNIDIFGILLQGAAKYVTVHLITPWLKIAFPWMINVALGIENLKIGKRRLAEGRKNLRNC